MGGRWPYSWWLVGCYRQDLFNITRNILVWLPSSFFSSRLVSYLFAFFHFLSLVCCHSKIYEVASSYLLVHKNKEKRVSFFLKIQERFSFLFQSFLALWQDPDTLLPFRLLSLSFSRLLPQQNLRSSKFLSSCALKQRNEGHFFFSKSKRGLCISF